VIIVSGDTIVYERYARGWNATQPHNSWSVSKSVVNALTGIAVARGLLSIEDSVCSHATLPRADHCNIKIRDLLEFASGLAWKESYEGESNQVSSVLAMLYGEGARDMMAFVAGHDSRDPPGATFMYSSGDTTFLSGVIDGPLRAAAGAEYEWPLLFEPLGMSSAVFEVDGRGRPIGSSSFYAVPRDMAKFGFLYLNDGCWAGERILPEEWVAASTVPSQPFLTRALAIDPGDVQGRKFWLNRRTPVHGDELPWPDVPDDAYAARGHWGQSITIVPSRDAVIVRVADDREKGFDFNRFVSLALAVAP
jgi:CubicO group peptidase (beta-lactamase class C family)